MRRKISDGILILLLIAMSIVAFGLFTLLPFRALDTGLVYGGF